MWAMPMAGLDGFTHLGETWDAAVKAAGGPDLWDGTSVASTHGAAELYVYREDLSYIPAEPREAEKDAPARMYDFWYAKPEMRQELEAAAKKISELYAEKKVDTSWRVYQAVTGPELPLYVVAWRMTSEADYHSNIEHIRKQVGAEAGELLDEANRCARRRDESWGWIIDDLSMTGGGGGD